MSSSKITKNNHSINLSTAADAAIVRGKFYNELKDDFDATVPSLGTVKADTVSEYTSGSGVTIDGVLLKDGTVTTTAPTVKSVAPAVTAFATGGKASATALTEEINVITVCATALDSVLLPAAAVGQVVKIINLGAAACAVYAAGTNTIDDKLTTEYVIIEPEDVVTFYAYTTVKWQSDFESDSVYTRVLTDTIAEKTAGSGVAIDGVLLKDNGISLLTGGISITPNVTQYTVAVDIDATEIVGTDAGDLGHANGVELVAAPGAGKALQFVNAVIIYDYDTAAYTDGAGDDLTIYQNSVAVSPAIATADLITKAGDTVINLSALAAADYVLGVNSNLNLACTAVTNPGTAAGVIRAYVTYNVITTGL